MPTISDDAPVLVGGGQWLERDPDPRDALSPLDVLERVARDAADASGAGARVLEALDTVGLVEVLGWKPRNGPQLLGARVGAESRCHLLTSTGGEMGLSLVNRVAERIAAGTSRVALVAGSNHMKSLRAARREKVRMPWPLDGDGEPEVLGAFRMGGSEREMAAGLRLPTEVYPLLENALRAARGLDLDTHREGMGRLMSRFTEVAAKNPYAWFPVFRSAEELVRVGPDNRMVGFPYPKYLNAVLDTDQAAGVLVLAAGAARALGIPEDRWVAWWGGGQCVEEPWFVSERPRLDRCPALRAAVESALGQARVELGQIDRFDFYSCFPVAVEMACHMLGLDEDDPRGFTVTGGLPYAGGPGSSYTLHALAAMVERLRERPGSVGLCTGNGWYLTKHSACVLASAPKAYAPPAPVHPEPAEAVPVAEAGRGPGRVEGYTVVHDREGVPTRGIVIGRLADDRRFLANTPDDPALLRSLTEREWVGAPGTLSGGQAAGSGGAPDLWTPD